MLSISAGLIIGGAETESVTSVWPRALSTQNNVIIRLKKTEICN